MNCNCSILISDADDMDSISVGGIVNFFKMLS